MMRVPFCRRAIKFRAIADAEAPAACGKLPSAGKLVTPKAEPAADKLVVPKTEPLAADKLVVPKTEPLAADKLVVPKAEPPAVPTKHVEPTIDLSNADDSSEAEFEEESQRWDDDVENDNEVFTRCANQECGTGLTKATAFPKAKTGREWDTSHIRHRCESCWTLHKTALVGTIKSKNKRKGKHPYPYLPLPLS